MKILNSFFILFLGIHAASAFNPGDDWCAELKSIPEIIAGDESKIKAEQTRENEMFIYYKSTVTLPGSDSVRIKHYQGPGRLSQVVGYYAGNSTDKEAEKIYTDLASKFKACFAEAVELEEAYVDGFDKGMGYYKGDGYSIKVAKYNSSTYELNKANISRVVVVVEYY